MTKKPQDQRDIEAREEMRKIASALHIAANAAGKMAVSIERGEHSLYKSEFQTLARAEMDIYAASFAADAMLARPAPEALGAAKGELSDAEILRIFEKETGFSTESNYCIVDADILGYTRAILAKAKGEQA